MSDAKTRPTDQAVDEYLSGLPDANRREDCRAVVQIMREVTGHEPCMWGTSIIGFGSYHYRYATGREGDAPIAGVSPRKDSLTLYLSYGFEHHEDLLLRLGKHKTGKACLYIKRLADVDQGVLRELIARSADEVVRANTPG